MKANSFIIMMMIILNYLCYVNNHEQNSDMDTARISKVDFS